jgi:hypothetical protein
MTPLGGKVDRFGPQPRSACWRQDSVHDDIGSPDISSGNADIGGNGYAGMIRSTGVVRSADPLRCGWLAAFGASWPAPALADGTPVDLYISAFASLESHELAALALTLGIVLFAVVTAIMLVRTRQRAAAAETEARREIDALTAEADRVNA